MKKFSALLGVFLWKEGEAAGGLVMLYAAGLALLLANSMVSSVYFSFVHYPFSLAGGATNLSDAVKDVLMVFFFAAVGMELKRDMRGDLAESAQIRLPLLAALAGMVVPAGIYLFINQSIPENSEGWAVPMATDIAFALCIFRLAARHLPSSLKLFLLAIAIFDDLGAIVVIAVFYSHGIAWAPLGLAGLCCVALIVLNRLRIPTLWPYLIVGIALWPCLHAAGIHMTIGGVMVGLAVPFANANRPHDSPLERGLTYLHPWVSFAILPLFAFVSAGIDLRGMHSAQFLTPLTLGVTLGLFLGKPLGILAISGLLVKCRLAALPTGVNWRQLRGVAVLAGIGFTMSLFITALAFNAALAEQAKLGVMAGSLLSAVVGFFLLRRAVV